MPDMERLTDELRVDLAKTPEDRAWAHGFNAGKYFARKQTACCVAFGALIAVLITVCTSL